MKNSNYLTMAIAVFAFTSFISSCMQDEILSPDRNNGSIVSITDATTTLPDAPDLLYGKPIKEYTRDWWTYVASFPKAQNPLNQASASAPKLSQFGPIQDVFGVKNATVLRTIDAIYNKEILVPVINTIRTYPSTDPNAKPARGQSVNEYLVNSADILIKQVTDVRVLLDGKQMDAVDIKRFSTDPFALKGNKDLINFLDLGITGNLQTAVADGFWFVADGLTKGKHLLVTHAEIPGKGIVSDVTYTINVR